jgi:hypothetical protein
MPGQQFSTYLQSAIPEFLNVTIEIGGIPLRLSDYDYVHALIAHNNIVDGTKESIAIFHPSGDLIDIIFLVMAGLSSYKKSAEKNSGLKPEDLKPGDLVEYDGKRSKFVGQWIDPVDGIHKFELAYDDPARRRREAPTNSRSTYPVDPYFSKVVRYFGERTTTERFDSQSKKSDKRKETIGTLLNMGDQPVNLADYSAFLVCNARPYLIELLHETRVNGAPFFKIFPSVKCKSNSLSPITRDLNQRRKIFYFAPSLSVADDVLRQQKTITALIADGKKVSNATSLLASIKSDYELEDIYLLEDSSKISSAYDLERNLGFKVWAWTLADLKSFPLPKLGRRRPRNTGPEEADSFAPFLESLVIRQNHLLERLARYREASIPVQYPSSFDESRHASLLDAISALRGFNKSRRDPSLSAFLFATFGITNAIFQSPFPAENIQRTKDNIAILEKDAVSVSTMLPTELKEYPQQVAQMLKDARLAFEKNNLKLDAIAAALISARKKACILVKRPDFIEPLRLALATRFPDSQIDFGSLSIASATRQIEPGFEILIWTFRPDLEQYSSAIFKADEAVFLLYGCQQKELDGIESFYNQRLSQYATAASRADIMKTVADVGGNSSIDQAHTPVPVLPPADLEELLFTPSSFASVYGKRYEGQEMVEAKQVLFESGFMSFFTKGHRISVFDVEKEEVRVVNASSIKVGDRVIFVKNERRTIFDEVMGYYSHKPEIIDIVKTVTAWHKALTDFVAHEQLTPEQLMEMLRSAGLDRGINTIEAWLNGETICPTEDNAIEIIARVTGDQFLGQNIDKVKSAGRTVHGLHVKVGLYLAQRVTQSVAASDQGIDDPVLRRKLNEVSSYAEIAEAVAVGTENIEIDSNLTNRLLAPEDL